MRFSFEEQTKSVGERVNSFVGLLLVSRVGKGPYVSNPTAADYKRFEEWQDKMDVAFGKLEEEDICINPEK